jgi:hypothetical protein
MQKKAENVPREANGGGLTRRQIIVGAAAAALATRVSIAGAAQSKQLRSLSRVGTGRTPMRRYMAAAAALGDGRVLVTGGYDRPLSATSTPSAVNTAVIYDPRSGTWSPVASMSVPRARHAAVTLADGRVAVLGGIAINPTSSVEIYDPQTDSWSVGTPLAQPRYDHTATSVGSDVYVLGGSSETMLTSVEVVRPGADSGRMPKL